MFAKRHAFTADDDSPFLSLPFLSFSFFPCLFFFISTFVREKAPWLSSLEGGRGRKQEEEDICL